MGDEHHADATNAGNAAWHRQLHHTGSDELSEDTAQTPGMRRYEAISGKRHGSRKLWMGKTVVAPGRPPATTTTARRRRGSMSFPATRSSCSSRMGTSAESRPGPGDYVYVPPYVPHREENPSPDVEAVVVIARTTQEGIVVNLPSLRAEVPELDRLVAELAEQSPGS